MPELTIFHTNDLHNGLNPEKAERIRQVRASCPTPSLLLDAGDAVGSGNVTYRPDGEPILDLMSEIGYDAMAVGNREFHLTRIGFQAKASRARFPLVSANIRARVEDAGLPCVPCVRKSLEGVADVCLLGITVPMITERMAVRLLSAYVFDDPVETAIETARRVRDRCDLVICLSHAGIAADRRIASVASGIDVIVGGHTHAVLPAGERIGTTLIVQAGSHGQWLGRIAISGTRGAWAMSAEQIEL
jgi:2',3'-cyclic-nucleotide 2'-phosphodiesterase (5'-nucleotidase family)